MKIAVIGSGISGLSIAQLLNDQHSVDIFEVEARNGGLIKCERVKDCLFHKVGGHVFNTKNEMVSKWFWSFFEQDKEFVKVKRNAKIYLQNKIIGYPIENYLYELDSETVAKIIDELFAIQEYKLENPFDYESFENFLKGNFGDTLYELYFGPYNSKIWRTSLKEVSMPWLEGKLPMPNLRDIILKNIVRSEENVMVHSTFYYPRNDGSEFIVQRFLNGLNVINNYVYSGSDFQNNTINQCSYDKIIYTGDIRKIPSLWKEHLKKANIDIEQLKKLKANGTSNIFCETDDSDISWLYLPEKFFKAHRIIYTGNFSETNNRGSRRKTCVVEFSGKVDYEVMLDEIKKLPGNLKAFSCNYEPNSYVVQDKTTRNLIAEIKDVLEPYGIYLLGRFAEWEYYNMDKAIEAAMSLREKL